MVCLYGIGEAEGGGEWTLGAPRECVSLHNGVGTGDPLTNIFLSCWFETEFCFLSFGFACVVRRTVLGCLCVKCFCLSVVLFICGASVNEFFGSWGRATAGLVVLFLSSWCQQRGAVGRGSCGGLASFSSVPACRSHMLPVQGCF